MIHYHGTPLSGPNDRAAESLIGRHALVSFAAPGQLDIVREVCQSYALDNGAYSAWKRGAAVNWGEYYRWAYELSQDPHFDFAIIPDVIDGGEAENDELLAEWPLGQVGVPVWHLHESIERLSGLASRYRKVALGSSGEFAQLKTPQWWARMALAFNVLAREDGSLRCKVHGLRMLDPEVLGVFPFSSADSINAGFNSHIDAAWSGTYEPPKPWRARVLMARIESVNPPLRWTRAMQQTSLLEATCI